MKRKFGNGQFWIPALVLAVICAGRTLAQSDWRAIDRQSADTDKQMQSAPNVAASCTGVEASCTSVSAPLQVFTTRWGDVETPYNPPSPTTQPDFGDIAALVKKFGSLAGAPIKARALLSGADAFGNVNIAPDLGFNHIAVCVNAIRGGGYPYTISSCP